VDPWEVLGLDRAAATVEGVRDVKRRLARLHHPDLVAGGGGGADAVADASARLAVVNEAADLALAELSTCSAAPESSFSGSTGSSALEDVAEATFSVDVLPVEAFELLLLAFSAIGDPKVVDEPYLLEGQVDDPFRGVARVELVPEAGGSLVTVTTWPFPRATTPVPTARAVAGRLVWEMKNLGAP